MRKWAAIAAAAIVIWAAVLAICYRRQIFSDKERQSWERYYLSAEIRVVLDGSNEFVLLSVDPIPTGLKADLGLTLEEEKQPRPTNGANGGKENFHDHLVLGRTEIKDLKRKRELLTALYRGVEKFQGLPASCFDPRHGIVAVAGTNRVELLICFECAQGGVYADSGQKWFLIGKESREIFNRTLEEAEVPLAK